MKKYFLIAIIAFVCFSQVSADNKSGKTFMEINLPSRTLSLYVDGVLLKEYPVCVGKRSTPTPQGEYRVVYKTVDPYWINKDVIVPPGPQNPLGQRWIGITKGIGIHGNNNPESIGTYASAGCIRMYNRDVEELYNVVSINTPVVIKYDRINIFEDKYSGGKAVIIYPDSYKKGESSNAQLLEKLREIELPEAIIEKASRILTKSATKPRTASEGIGIFLNGSLITCDSLEEQGEIYVNYKAAEDILGLTSGIADRYGIEIKEVEGVIYVNLSQIVREYGGTMSYDAPGRNAYISMKVIKVNGAFAGLNHGDYDKVDFLAAEAVEQLDYEYSEDSVDIRLFDKEMMKLKRNNIWSVNVDNVVEALEGYKSINSCYGIVDLTLPTFLRFDEEYFKTDIIEGSLVLSPETAHCLWEKTGWAEEAFLYEGEEFTGNINLESFLEDYDYNSNNLKTVIDIKLKESQSLIEN